MGLASLRRFLYFPERLPVDAPLPPHARGAREVWLEAADGVRIHGLYWAPPPGRPVVLFFHGNAGEVYQWALVRHDLAALDSGLLIIDYHGYGKSAGKPSEAALHADGEAALRWLGDEAGVAAQRVVLHGKSLGGGVAGRLAATHDVLGLILESTFTSIPGVAENLFGRFLPILGTRSWEKMMPDRFATVEHLAAVRCPVLVVHGERDSLIPVAHAHSLFEAAREPKELYLVPAGDHNDVAWVAGESYGRRLREWLARCLARADRRVAEE